MDFRPASPTPALPCVMICPRRRGSWPPDAPMSARDLSMTGRCQVTPSQNFAGAPRSMVESAANQLSTCSSSGSADKQAPRFCCKLICWPVAAKEPSLCDSSESFQKLHGTFHRVVGLRASILPNGRKTPARPRQSLPKLQDSTEAKNPQDGWQDPPPIRSPEGVGHLGAPSVIV